MRDTQKFMPFRIALGKVILAAENTSEDTQVNHPPSRPFDLFYIVASPLMDCLARSSIVHPFSGTSF